MKVIYFSGRCFKQCFRRFSPLFHRMVLALLPLLLAGCVQDTFVSSIKPHSRLQAPQQQLADYLSIDCQDIWRIQEQEAIRNPLFWLRGMDCAKRLSPINARTQARQWMGDSWQDTFKRGILLSNAKITPSERRRYMTKLDAMTGDVPSQVRSLFQVWRDGQALLLQLSAERTRYSKLQQSMDSALDSLRDQQRRLRSQLTLTTRKLENLTDIERQLSSRKPAAGYIQDSSISTGSGKATSIPGAGNIHNEPTKPAAKVDDKQHGAKF